MPVLEGSAVTSWAVCGLPRVLLPVLSAGKFTLGQCEGKSKSPDSPCQVTLAVFPGSLWGAAFPHTPSNLIPTPWWKAASAQEERGPEAVCEPTLPSPLPGVPLGCCSPKVTPCRVLFSCKGIPVPSSASRGGTTLADDHGMTFSPWSAGSSPAERVPPLTQNSSFPPKKWKPREFLPST